MADDLEDNIRDNAKAPAKASGDAGSVEQHNLKDQIEADKYLAFKRAELVAVQKFRRSPKNKQRSVDRKLKFNDARGK